MTDIVAIPALNDNYIWLIIHQGLQQALIVDPGEAMPVIKTLQQRQLKLVGILITHHHWDHTNGINDLINYQDAPVYGPINESIPHCQYPLQQDDTVCFDELGMTFSIMDIPGHTKGHIAYVGLGGVFCGDTLFTGGCGRIFEGTATQMLQSLDQLASLAEETLVYCGHEYTEKNLDFAQLVEPDNKQLQIRLQQTRAKRAKSQPTVPSSLELELATNPFLRTHVKSVQQAVSQHCKKPLTTRVDVLRECRAWKDNF